MKTEHAAGPIARIALVLGAAFAAGACQGSTVSIADGEAQAIVYGTVVSNGEAVAGSRVLGVVYTANQCGDEFRARPFDASPAGDGTYRVHLRVLTRDPFHGCIEVAAVDTISQSSSATVIEEGVYFALSPPLDSIRIDLGIP